MREISVCLTVKLRRGEGNQGKGKRNAREGKGIEKTEEEEPQREENHFDYPFIFASTLGFIYLTLLCSLPVFSRVIPTHVATLCYFMV